MTPGYKFDISHASRPFLADAETFQLYLGGYRSLQLKQSPERIAAHQVTHACRTTSLVNTEQGHAMHQGCFEALPVPDAEAEGDRNVAVTPLGRDRWRWNTVTQMVLYGLGSPRKSVASRYPEDLKYWHEYQMH